MKFGRRLAAPGAAPAGYESALLRYAARARAASRLPATLLRALHMCVRSAWDGAARARLTRPPAPRRPAQDLKHAIKRLCAVAGSPAAAAKSGGGGGGASGEDDAFDERRFAAGAHEVDATAHAEFKELLTGAWPRMLTPLPPQSVPRPCVPHVSGRCCQRARLRVLKRRDVVATACGLTRAAPGCVCANRVWQTSCGARAR